MSTNNVSKVAVGKPKAGGAIFWAPKGTTIPTNATAALDEAFSCLGYCSEDGFVESEERDTEEIKAWGGDIVLRPQTSYSKTFQFTPLQTDVDVLKFRFGAANVEEGADGAITVVHNSGALPHGVMVVEIALGDDMVLRKVVGDAQVTEFEDTSYVDGEPVSYGATVAAFDFTGNGDYVKDYYAKVADSTGSSTGSEGDGN